MTASAGTAVCPGSYDPVTNGHLDIIERGRQLFDEVVVAVSLNSSKHPYFSLPERLQFLKQAVELPIGDLRFGVDIVEIVMVLDLPPQFVGTLCDRGHDYAPRTGES